MPGKTVVLLAWLAFAGGGPARAQPPFDARLDPAFEAQAFGRFASHAGYGTGRDAVVQLSGHGPVQSVASNPAPVALDRLYYVTDPPYAARVAVASRSDSPF